MANLDPEHLLEQADRLILPLPAETEPRQTDLRRAVSSAYYGVFHFTVAAAVDMFVGVTNRHSEQYKATYRTVTHTWLRALCDHVRGLLKPKSLPHLPGIDFFGPIVGFAANVSELQEARHSSDYDPSFDIKPHEAKVWISMARDAVTLFRSATDQQQAAFMALLLFNLRK
jgi:uncharacterized protein (UPF0332 family)